MTEYDIRELDDNDDKEKIFFKSRWIKEKTVKPPTSSGSEMNCGSEHKCSKESGT